jgi:GrpB-like predicted nucleotidyltransferase (UPF0157 family)
MSSHPSYPPEITERQFGDPDDLRDGRVGGAARPPSPIVVVDPDPEWPAAFAREAERVRAALGDVVVRLEHVGSTSVPGLPAKPIIDIDLQVPDSAAEETYVPALERSGYRLVLREPWWNGHRMLLGPGGGSHLHVFPAGAPETLRHLLFRDWLRTHPDDLALYAQEKRLLARTTATDPSGYSLAKNAVIDDIYERIFSVPPESHPAWPTADASVPDTSR